MLHLLQNLSAKDIAWSIFIVLDIAFVFWVLHRKGKKPGKVVEMKLDEFEESISK